jgi:Uncharacterized protein containing piwi/argonaute domain
MLTNFFEIHFAKPTFSIRRFPYSEEKLRALRREFNATCSFFRNGDWIYASPAEGKPDDFGERTTVQVDSAPEIVQSLIRHVIFRWFRDFAPARMPLEFNPLTFRAKAERGFELPAPVNQEVSFDRLIEVYVKALQSLTGSARYGLVVSSRRRWRVLLTVAQMQELGFPLEGKTVLEKVSLPGLENVIAPDDSVLGIVEAIEDDTAVIRSNEGRIERKLDSLYLQRTREQIGEYVSHRIGKHRATDALNNIYGAHHRTLEPNQYFGDIQKFGSFFSEKEYTNADGVSFTISNRQLADTPEFDLQETTLVFGFTPGSVARQPAQGLRDHGPCDKEKFDKKSPHFLVLFREENRAAATEFVGRLINGVPGSRYFPRGLKNIFFLHDITYDLVVVPGHRPEDYERAISSAIDASVRKYDLAIAEFSDTSHNLTGRLNPYFRAKAKLMAAGIPMQGVRTSHLRGDRNRHGFTLGPTALQIYAKMGGVPWILMAGHTVDHELVVGIESSIKRANLWTSVEQSRVIGLTTFFLGDGTFVQGQELKAVPYESYLEELVKSLATSLKEVSETYWRKGNQVRIVFHVFKPLRDVEIEAVQAVVKQFPQYQINFAFVTISQSHPWLLFEDAVETNGKWVVALCNRGRNLEISPTECLLQIQGPADRPNTRHRPPSPVLIRLHERSTFRDLQYIAQQVLDFAFICWRTYYPIHEPVTQFYSQRIAKISSQLADTPNWDPTVVSSHFRRKQWFL